LVTVHQRATGLTSKDKHFHGASTHTTDKVHYNSRNQNSHTDKFSVSYYTSSTSRCPATLCGFETDKNKIHPLSNYSVNMQRKRCTKNNVRCSTAVISKIMQPFH